MTQSFVGTNQASRKALYTSVHKIATSVGNSSVRDVFSKR